MSSAAVLAPTHVWWPLLVSGVPAWGKACKRVVLPRSQSMSHRYLTMAWHKERGVKNRAHVSPGKIHAVTHCCIYPHWKMFLETVSALHFPLSANALVLGAPLCICYLLLLPDVTCQCPLLGWDSAPHLQKWPKSNISSCDGGLQGSIKDSRYMELLSQCLRWIIPSGMELFYSLNGLKCNKTEINLSM